MWKRKSQYKPQLQGQRLHTHTHTHGRQEAKHSGIFREERERESVWIMGIWDKIYLSLRRTDNKEYIYWTMPHDKIILAWLMIWSLYSQWEIVTNYLEEHVNNSENGRGSFRLTYVYCTVSDWSQAKTVREVTHIRTCLYLAKLRREWPLQESSVHVVMVTEPDTPQHKWYLTCYYLPWSCTVYVTWNGELDMPLDKFCSMSSLQLRGNYFLQYLRCYALN